MLGAMLCLEDILVLPISTTSLDSGAQWTQTAADIEYFWCIYFLSTVA